jgi:ribonuclease D
VAGPDTVAIIDPLVKGLDLKPLLDLFLDQNVVKVFHACRQDLEIFFHMGGVIPKPLFDTQIAAMACGFADSVGYETLVNKLANKQLDKSSRFSDWSKRPLTERQITYAAADVTHLRDIYVALNKKLEKNDRLDWLAEEMRDLSSPATYEMLPENAWKRLKLRSSVRRNLGVLIEVAEWREIQAQKRDLPRGRVLKDDVVYEIVSQKPQSLEAIENMRFAPNGLSRMPGAKDLIEAINRGAAINKKDLPNVAPPNPPTTKGNGSLVELLKVLLKRISEQEGVASKLIANVADLEKIALDDKADVPAMHGWRLNVFGEKAIQLKHGKVGLGMKNGKLDVVELG